MSRYVYSDVLFTVVSFTMVGVWILSIDHKIDYLILALLSWVISEIYSLRSVMIKSELL